ncbi:hypothetical protein RvY_08615 [Ramazzottius varieornatus]|uniref:Uncharacterized protein n=1 Tax=Ramazzottius varieornatus TaxID=947166 RepID=A0A1D1VB40_RAMVA|nr:hypothetical protein RvY_08615 [Ramazzottius varieornatus]
MNDIPWRLFKFAVRYQRVGDICREKDWQSGRSLTTGSSRDRFLSFHGNVHHIHRMARPSPTPS